MTSPLDLLLRYQRRWADDAHRFKIGLMARQVGKDFSSGAEGIRDCYAAELRDEKVTWMIGAPSERQALESFEKWKEWAEAFRVAIADYQEKRDGGSEALLKSATMTFPGGSRVIAVPGRPDTVRGFSANVLLTEFAFFDDPDATWRAVFPSITNPLRGGLKKIRLISTPNGQGNKFHDLWVKNYQVDGAKWSCHRVTIEDAVREGLPIDIEEQRAAIDDPDGWAQEYLCEFMDTAAVLLSYDLIAAAENPQAASAQPPEFWATTARNAEPLYLGIDFGRKRDLTVCWALVKVAGTYHLTREVLELAKLPTGEQMEILRPRIARSRRACFDYTGPGVGLGDFLVKEFGEWDPQKDRFGRVELCTFTADLKQEIFSKLRMAFDQRTLGIPASRVVREDLHSVHRVTTPGGNVTYRAPHTADGHADRCTALALALRAAGTGSATFSYTKVTPTERTPIG
ncbi:MAG: terminase family protein [Verrucomicrobiae bacterium]|nr:terminase family protein [Verrucomicrobiae bacterium]